MKPLSFSSAPGLGTRSGGGLSRRRLPPQRGVALIITLILLAVITFMAVTFLVISRSEKGAVTTATDQSMARFAAESALDRAKTEVVARIMGFTNPFNFELIVSTNFVNPRGFQRGLNHYTNVSYNYPDGTPVVGNDALLNLTRLVYNPRPPVYVTNRFYANSNEFRFYWDLNRNGRYETNGFLPVINPLGGYYDLAGNLTPQLTFGQTLSNYFVGDPEWIGVLERPDLPHSSTNLFVARYAYLIAPASKTLDVNYIHNYARLLEAGMNPVSGDGFMRNQGVGTWEVNLAAFLTDLNTNFWPFPQGNLYGAPYRYRPEEPTQPNTGAAFDDALSFVRYRYNRNYRTYMPTLREYFGGSLRAAGAVNNDYVDAYSRGPVMTNTTWSLVFDNDRNLESRFAWSGADNPNHYFTIQDYFDPSKTSLLFSNRLWSAGTNTGSYDRYTYYRMLSQLGTDTSWEQPRGKINLNYDNRVQSNGTTLAISATNFIPWQPVDFFTVTANRLLENAGFSTSNPANPAARISATHIPIYPTNLYTPAIHQLLQLAANVYDATTNQTYRTQGAASINPIPPTVFRPLFARTNVNGSIYVYISGYEEVVRADELVTPRLWHDPKDPTFLSRNILPRDMIYGVPLVIGAKKGFPNFNEFAMQTLVQVTRKLEFRRPNLTSPVNETNQMFMVTVSNIFGLEAWNSYSNAYPRDLQLRVTNEMFAVITNQFGETLLAYTNPPVRRTAVQFIPANSWFGYVNPQIAQASFRLPYGPAEDRFYYLSNAVYATSPLRSFQSPVGRGFERIPANAFEVPRWFLNLRTRVQFILVDTSANNRIVDYVNLDSSEPPLDITDLLTLGGSCVGSYVPDGNDGSLWCTNRMGNNPFDARVPTFGVLNQILIGLDLLQPDNWRNFQSMSPPGLDRAGAIDFFRAQFSLPPTTYHGTRFSKTNIFYAPFAPTRNLYFNTSWQANDPLVHHTIGDLIDFLDNFHTNRITFENAWTTNGLGSINKRFEPWGGNPVASSSSQTRVDMGFKDPGVTRSDDWDFPTNKFANVGWLGRVHRGTPWQTVQLKSASPTNLLAWLRWSGNGIFTQNVGQYDTNAVPFGFITNDAAFTHPRNDRYILDLFTTGINDNATRSQLSVNQTNLAAWSAVLAGVNVLPEVGTNTFIPPAGAYLPDAPTPVAQIVAGIARAQTNQPTGVFRRLGDVLATPELTVASPFLTGRTNWYSDAVVERIPQQILGLLKGSDEPRFVVYAVGQTLKPAERSLVTSGPFIGLCTNYQVTAEVATRTVFRLDGVPPYPPPLIPQKPFTNLNAVIEKFNVLPPE